MTGLRLTAEQRRMIRRLSAEGLSLRQVARQVSCSQGVVATLLCYADHRSSSRASVRSRPARTPSPNPGHACLPIRRRTRPMTAVWSISSRHALMSPSNTHP